MAPRAVLTSQEPAIVSNRSITPSRDRLTLLHLGDQLLVEHATGLLVQWAVDGDDIALSKHVLEVLNSSAANLLLLLGGKWLVVEVEELLAVEWLQSAEDTLADTANSDGTDDLAFEVVLVLGNLSDVPVTAGDLLVSWDEVSDKDEHGHDDVLGDGDDVGASDLSNGDTAIGLVGGVQVDMVGTNTGGHGELEVLRLGETLSGQVTWVESEGMSMLIRLLQGGLSYGVVMMTSASTSSWSNLLFSPSLSEVVTRVWPCSSIHFLRPSSFSVVPSS